MKIILSPAKKMNVDTDTLEYQGIPVYLEQTRESWMAQAPVQENEIVEKVLACGINGCK